MLILNESKRPRDFVVHEDNQLEGNFATAAVFVIFVVRSARNV